MRRFYLVVNFLLTAICLSAQNQDIAYPHIAVMTPKAAALSTYTDIPVSYYTGVPEISIPLYEIDLDGFKLPITLSYHASGIKVSQEATWVGLGWSLNAGGMISRSVMDGDDFMENNYDFYHPYYKKGFYEAPTFNCSWDSLYTLSGYGGSNGVWINMEWNKIADSEPDIFYYNLPTLSGKFIFDNQHHVVLFDKNHNIKVEVINLSNLYKRALKITDSEGNQFFFNDREISKTYSDNTWLYKNTPGYKTKYDCTPESFVNWEYIRAFDNEDSDGMEPIPCTPYDLTSSWCLSKIITNKGREVNFEYANEDEYLPTQESCEVYTNNQGRRKFFYRSKIVNQSKRLKKITWDYGSVSFNCSSREDIKGTAQKLDQVEIRLGGGLWKFYNFSYSYFNDDYSEDDKYKHVFKRLKLTGLQEESSAHEVSYSFDYYDGSFPAKNSKNVDYWGAQNGKTYGDEYCVGINLGDKIYPGVTKDADFNYAVIGSLKQITYPTGGFSRFTYESNSYNSLGITTNNAITSNGQSGGTRITYPGFKVCAYNAYSEESLEAKCDTAWFETLASGTLLTIHHHLENMNCEYKDPTYFYGGEYLAELYRVNSNGSWTSIMTYDCPYLFSNSNASAWSNESVKGIGCEEEYNRGKQLEKGKYVFVARCPPRDVCAEYFFSFDHNIKKLDRNGEEIQKPVVNTKTPDGGGLRIAKIETDATTRLFKYSGGKTLVSPVYYYFGKRFNDGRYTEPSFVQVSESKTPLSTFKHGTFIGYDWVEESTVDNKDTITVRHYFANGGVDEPFDDKFPDSPTTINYENGLPLKTAYYRNKKLLKEVEYDYSNTMSEIINALRDRTQKYNEEYMQIYSYQVEYPLKSSEEETIYETDGTISREVKYGYNDHDLLNTTTQVVDSVTVVNTISYPFELTDAVSKKMVTANMLNVPVEVTNRVNGNVMSGQKVTYKEENGLLLPAALYRLETENGAPVSSYQSGYVQRMTFDKYNSYGNLQQMHDGQQVVSYLWSYKGGYPIAEVRNATYAQLTSILGSSTLSGFEQKAAPTLAEVNSLLSLLRSQSAGRHILITSYTHQPNAGVSTITLPSGMLTSYYYDALGRLYGIQDTNNKTTAIFKYHYQNQ